MHFLSQFALVGKLLPAVACHIVFGSGTLKGGLFNTASIYRMGAASLEFASRWRIGG